MAHYTPQQIKRMDRVLLRPLKVGESFRVANPLTENNVGIEMRSFEGYWLTVCEAINVAPQDSGYRYYDYLYEKFKIPLFVYKAKEDIVASRAFLYNWHDYHMNIYDTNLQILENDRKKQLFIKQTPNLPII